MFMVFDQYAKIIAKVMICIFTNHTDFSLFLGKFCFPRKINNLPKREIIYSYISFVSGTENGISQTSPVNTMDGSKYSS